MDFKLLEKTLSDHAQPRFRARQVWAWAARGAGSFQEMTDLPRALRVMLAEQVPFSSLTLQAETRASDGSVKALFYTADGHPLEAVMMSYPARSAARVRRSICLSSQSGCPLTCTFCATGAMRFARNLSASEIVDQALHLRRASEPEGPPPSNCVFNGHGRAAAEPRQRARRLRPAARPRYQPPAHRDLHRRLDPGDRSPLRAGAAAAPGAVRARWRGRTAHAADARQRALSAA